ncbi:molybdenum cofactor biosynthesis protein MoaE [Kytococcus sp. Marseille-QA3725]
MVTDPRVVHAAVTDEPLDADALETAVLQPSHGAVTRFVGRVRDHDPEAAGEVVSLDYSAHPDAPAILQRITTEVLDAHDPEGRTRVAVAHRTGHLEVGDLAIVVAVASAHRAITFTVCSELVEQVKARLPIWKHQHEADGRAVWSALGLDEAATPTAGRST